MPDSAAGLLELVRRIAALKDVPRTGWLDRGIAPPQAESVADHSYGVALLAWLCAVERRAAGAQLDPSRVLALALVHDLAEAETGDVTPYDPAQIPNDVSADSRRAFLNRRHVRDPLRDGVKRAREDAAMQALVAALPDAAGAELATAWSDLQEGTSAEASFVKQVDHLETFLQSRRYRRGHPDLPVESFRHEVLETVDDPLLAALRDSALAVEED